MSHKPLEIQEFVALLINHQEILRSYIITQIPGSPDVRDIVQEVNIVIWEKRTAFEPGTNFGAWACTVARYKVLEHHRKEARRKGLLVFNDELSRTLASETQERSPDVLDDRLRALEHCLSKLSLANRRMLTARYASSRGGMEQIVSETGRTRESLRVSLSRIRDSLRRCVSSFLAMERGMS